jgi:hypothetical protein
MYLIIIEVFTRRKNVRKDMKLINFSLGKKNNGEVPVQNILANEDQFRDRT